MMNRPVGDAEDDGGRTGRDGGDGGGEAVKKKKRANQQPAPLSKRIKLKAGAEQEEEEGGSGNMHADEQRKMSDSSASAKFLSDAADSTATEAAEEKMDYKTEEVRQEEAEGVNVPNERDILSGRGKFVNSHPGNVRFRALVAQHKVAYVSCPKARKTSYAEMIVQKLHKEGARFLKQREPPTAEATAPGTAPLPSTSMPPKLSPNKPSPSMKWYELDLKHALLKTRQALREGAPRLTEQMQHLGSYTGGGSGSSNSSEDDDNERDDPQRAAKRKAVTASSSSDTKNSNTKKRSLDQLHIPNETISGSNNRAALMGDLSERTNPLLPPSNQYSLRASPTTSFLMSTSPAAARIMAQQGRDQHQTLLQQDKRPPLPLPLPHHASSTTTTALPPPPMQSLASSAYASSSPLVSRTTHGITSGSSGSFPTTAATPSSLLLTSGHPSRLSRLDMTSTGLPYGATTAATRSTLMTPQAQSFALATANPSLRFSRYNPPSSFSPAAQQQQRQAATGTTTSPLQFSTPGTAALSAAAAPQMASTGTTTAAASLLSSHHGPMSARLQAQLLEAQYPSIASIQRRTAAGAGATTLASAATATLGQQPAGQQHTRALLGQLSSSFSSLRASNTTASLTQQHPQSVFVNLSTASPRATPLAPPTTNEVNSTAAPTAVMPMPQQQEQQQHSALTSASRERLLAAAAAAGHDPSRLSFLSHQQPQPQLLQRGGIPLSVRQMLQLSWLSAPEAAVAAAAAQQQQQPPQITGTLPVQSAAETRALPLRSTTDRSGRGSLGSGSTRSIGNASESEAAATEMILEQQVQQQQQQQRRHHDTYSSSVLLPTNTPAPASPSNSQVSTTSGNRPGSHNTSDVATRTPGTSPKKTT